MYYKFLCLYYKFVYLCHKFSSPPPQMLTNSFVYLSRSQILMISLLQLHIYLCITFKWHLSNHAFVVFLSLYAGPFVGALTIKYGCRKIVFLGGIVMIIAMVASSFASEMWHLYITMSLEGMWYKPPRRGGGQFGGSNSKCVLTALDTSRHLFIETTNITWSKKLHEGTVWIK